MLIRIYYRISFCVDVGKNFKFSYLPFIFSALLKNLLDSWKGGGAIPLVPSYASNYHYKISNFWIQQILNYHCIAPTDFNRLWSVSQMNSTAEGESTLTKIFPLRPYFTNGSLTTKIVDSGIQFVLFLIILRLKK